MDKQSIIQELQFKAVRSSGSGGQHANKVSTKVELVFDVANSKALTFSEKQRIYLRLKNRLTKANILVLQCDESRSQHKNKDLVIKRFLDTIEKALKVKKKRKRSQPTKSAIEKRLKSKKKTAEKKANRSKPNH
ncbi:aminoacyl-tRNA hydrolase [Costertonia aggregata]|uniref:Aminoacyl-tRNA hydrolase n=1 Tax=Costertonia aggregata TaxID=343403 RepID=A0A7H9AUX5_9FLAO|nr:aminoacyl-tRNA hydrolase [Costertonia aggregata]